MTTAQAKHKLGQVVYLCDKEGLLHLVTIRDHKTAYGNDLFLVEAQLGTSRWIRPEALREK